MARILVADDDADMRLVLRVALEGLGHDVVEADNGTDALEVCRTGGAGGVGGVDAAVLDVSMPGLEGPEVVASVRADPERKDLPVLLLSAGATPDDIDGGLAAGADDYLTKPFQLFELHRRVDRLLRLARHDEPGVLQERVEVRARAHEAVGRLRRR